MNSSWCNWLLYYFKKKKEPQEVYLKKNDDNIKIDKKYYLDMRDDYLEEEDGPIWF